MVVVDKVKVGLATTGTLNKAKSMIGLGLNRLFTLHP
ncbi:hypothetical protein VITU9109_16793 [Vibrio tubiashii ATCC 19109]|uniref:Transposase n=1 Tax=Vibrio tubiashii ATCC 19109 TaxID=1051646 RepID=A0ABP2LFF3_9VIBR|nr:hypothetical protein VITU9109_16793 [Vibrio tubiashii ATCC 19109]